MAEIGRNDRIVFAFCVIYIKLILNENADMSELYVGVFYSTKLLHRGQNDPHSFSSVKHLIYCKQNFSLVSCYCG